MNFNLKLKSFFLALMAVAALPGSTATPRAKGNLCGGAVGGAICVTGICGDDEGCTTMLWDRVEGDTSYSCLSASGPCDIGYGDDWVNGKNPKNCKGDTFFLWDEPIGTNGKSMNQVVDNWKQFVQKYGAELREFRNRGGLVTAPMWKAGGKGECPQKNIHFLEQCGDLCRNTNNNGYIGALTCNYYAGSGDDASAAARWAVNTDMVPATKKYPDLPVYITNWCTENCRKADCQMKAMKASKIMLDVGWRVYWYSSKDCPNGHCDQTPDISNNLFSEMGPNEKTMGQEWKEICDTYPHSGPSPGTPSPALTPTPTTPPQCKDWCEADRGTHPESRLCGSGNMASLCGGCDFCKPAGVCKDWCEADRGTHPESRLCGSGNMASLCGGCDFCRSARTEL